MGRTRLTYPRAIISRRTVDLETACYRQASGVGLAGLAVHFAGRLCKGGDGFSSFGNRSRLLLGLSGVSARRAAVTDTANGLPVAIVNAGAIGDGFPVAEVTQDAANVARVKRAVGGLVGLARHTLSLYEVSP